MAFPAVPPHCLLPAADLGTRGPETLSMVLTTASYLRTGELGSPSVCCLFVLVRLEFELGALHL
jgi:hypothetical protein